MEREYKKIPYATRLCVYISGVVEEIDCVLNQWVSSPKFGNIKMCGWGNVGAEVHKP